MKIKSINISTNKLFFNTNFKQNIVDEKKQKGDQFLPTQYSSSLENLDIARIKNIGISNFRLVDSQTVRGVTLANQKTSILKELKESGINTIIDLRTEGDENSIYAANCRENGLDYFNFKLKINMPIFNPLHATKLSKDERTVEKEKFLKILPNFFEKMNSGKNYIACLLGLHRTDLAISLNYLLNPIEPTTPPSLSHMFYDNETNFTNKYVGAIKNLMRNLTDEDKRKLHLPENFKDIFNSRILKLRIMNKVKS